MIGRSQVASKGSKCGRGAYGFLENNQPINDSVNVASRLSITGCIA